MSEEITTSAPAREKNNRPFVPPVTRVLVGSTVAVFLLQLLCLYLYHEDIVGNALAFGPQALANHHYWTVLTYAWGHAVAMFGTSEMFWLHLLANMIPLICLGPFLEEILGRWRFLGLYLGGAIAAGLVWYLFEHDSDDAIIGASGAIFALIAAAGTIAPRGQVIVLVLYLLPFYLLPPQMSLRTVAWLFCGVEFMQFFYGWLPEVAHTAHLGGAAFGFLYIVALQVCSRKSMSID